MCRVIPYALIFPVAVIGNVLVMIVVYRNKPMRKTINFFIVNMAFSDLIFTVISVPRVVAILFGYKWLVYGLLGSIFCRMVPFGMEIAIVVSVLTIVAISLDRYLAVTFPLKTFMNRTYCWSFMLATWLISIGVKIPTLLATDLDEFEGEIYCIVDLDLTFGAGSGDIYFKFKVVVLYAIPFAITVGFNFAIIVTMNKRTIPGNTVANTNNRYHEKTNRKVISMVLIVVAAFLLCWSLYFVLMVLRQNNIQVPCNVLYLRLLLAHFNAALTPLLYAIFSENYRQGFGEIFSAQLGCRLFFVSQGPPSSPRGRGQSSRSSFELQTLAAPQYGSTAQLME